MLGAVAVPALFLLCLECRPRIDDAAWVSAPFIPTIDNPCLIGIVEFDGPAMFYGILAVLR